VGVVGVGVGKGGRDETPGPAGKERVRKKYVSGGQQPIGTATSTTNTREVEEVIGILILFVMEW
jgi:hypothetical protein